MVRNNKNKSNSVSLFSKFKQKLMYLFVLLIYCLSQIEYLYDFVIIW